MQLSFSEIENLFKSNKERLGDIGLGDFARLANTATGTDAFAQADKNPFQLGVKQFSTGYDKWVNENLGGVQDVAGKTGSKLFDFFGQNTAVGEQVGRDAVRGTLDYVPLIAGSLLAPFTGSASFWAGAGVTGALAGSGAYEKTDSTLQTAMAAGLPFVGGKIGEVGARAGIAGMSKIPGAAALGFKGGEKILAPFGDDAARMVEATVAKTFADRLAGSVGAETLLNVGTMLADEGINFVEGKEVSNPFTLENILSNALDPTLVFSVGELVKPSVVATKLIDTEAQKGRVKAADLQDAVDRGKAAPTTQAGKTVADVESFYDTTTRDLRKKKASTKDEDERAFYDATLAKLEAQRKEFRERISTGDEAAYDMKSVFGKTVEDSYAEWQAKKAGATEEAPNVPTTFEEKVEEANGQAMDAGQKPIVNEDLQEIVLEHTENLDSLEDAIEKTEVVVEQKTTKLKKPSFDRQVRSIVNEVRATTQDRTRIVQAVRERLIPDYDINNEEHLLRADLIGNIVDNKLRDKTPTPEQLNARAAGGEKGGRPQGTTEKPEVNDWFAEREKISITDKDVQAEFKLLANVNKMAGKGVERENTLSRLAASYKSWHDKKEAGALTLGKKTVEKGDRTAELAVLKNMLTATKKNSFKPEQKFNVVKDKIHTKLNHGFSTYAEASEYALKMAEQYPEFDFTAPLSPRKGKQVVIYSARTSTDIDASSTTLPTAFVFDESILREAAKTSSGDESVRVKTEKVVEVNETVEAPVVKEDGVAVVEKSLQLLDELEEDLEIRSRNGEELDNVLLSLDRAREMLQSKDLETQVKGARAAAMLYADHSYVDFGGSANSLQQSEELYHGSPNNNLNAFDRLTYLTRSKSLAEGYADANGTVYAASVLPGKQLNLWDFDDWVDLVNKLEQDGVSPKVLLSIKNEIVRFAYAEKFADPELRTWDSYKTRVEAERATLGKNENGVSYFWDVDGFDLSSSTLETESGANFSDKTVLIDSLFEAGYDTLGQLEGGSSPKEYAAFIVRNPGNVSIKGTAARMVDYQKADFQASIPIAPRSLVDRLADRHGIPQGMREAFHEKMERLFTVFDLNDVSFRELMDKTIRGRATIARPIRELLLGGGDLESATPEQKMRMIEYVAGHEIGHLVENAANIGMLRPSQQKAWEEFRSWVNDATPEDMRLSLEIARDTFLPESYRGNEILETAFQTTSSAEENRANLIAMWALGQAHSTDQVGLNLLPRPISRAIGVLADMARSVYSIIRSTLRALPFFRPNNLMHSHVHNMAVMLRNMKQASQDTTDFYNEARGLSTFGPQAHNYRNFGGDDIIPPEDSAGAAVHKVVKDFVMQFDQAVRTVPALRSVGATVHTSIAERKAMMKSIVGVLTGEIDPAGNPTFASYENKLDWEKVTSNPKLNKILGDWFRLQNTTKPDNVNKAGMELSLDDLKSKSPELYGRIQALNASDRGALTRMKERFKMAHMEFAKVFGEHAKEVGEAFTQSYLGHKMEDKWADVPGLAHLLHEAVRGLGALDPVVQSGAQELLAKVASQMPPEVFYKAFDLAKMATTREAEILASMMGANHFTSEIRVGKHLLKWVDEDGATGSLAFDTIKDAQAYRKKLENDGKQITALTTVQREKPIISEPEWVSAVEEMDKKNIAMVDAMDVPDDIKGRMKSLFDYRAEFQSAFGKDRVPMPTQGRKFADGRHELDMVSSQIAYFQYGANMIHQQIMRNRLEYQFANPELKDARVRQDVERVKTMLANFAESDTKLGTNIATFNAAYFLGMNFGTGIVELAQPMFTYVPEMIARGVGFVKANSIVHRAQKEAVKFTMKHLPSKALHKVGENVPWVGELGRDNNDLWENPEHTELMNWAAKRNLISLTHMTDVVDTDFGANTDLSSVVGSKGLKKKTVGERLVSPVKSYGKLSLKFYQNFTEFNARVGLLSGYELAKEQGYKGQRAFEMAEEFARLVTFSGGKVNRPVNFSGRDPFFRTVGQAMYSLNGYVTGMLSMMSRYYTVGYSKREIPGLSAEERKSARKALRTLIATQMVGAGTMGLPFAAAFIKLLEATTGLEFEREVREGLSGLFNQDEEEDGGLLADVVLNGAANALSSRVLPGAPDFASRLQIGGVMGVNSYDGFSLGTMLGPSTSVIENVAKGVKNATGGNTGQAFEDFAPIAWKKIINMVRNDGEFRDTSGGLLASTDRGEQVAYAMGLTPQRISKIKHYDRLQRQHEENALNQEKRWHDEATEMYFKNPRAAMALLKQRAMNDPYFDYDGSVEKIAERVEKRTFARDPRMSGTYRGTKDNEVMLRDLVGKQQPQELARLMARQQVKQNLGGGYSLNGVTQRRQLTRAQLIDNIQTRMPYMSRAAAATMADEMLKR